jgi:hypothetical protein
MDHTGKACQPYTGVAVKPLELSPSEIEKYYATRVPDLRQTDGRVWRGPCPIHHGQRDSFAVKPKTGEWFCHSECGRGGGVIQLEMEMAGCDSETAKAEVFHIAGRNRSAAQNPKIKKPTDCERPTDSADEWRTVAKYVYTDESGEPLFRVIRREHDGGAKREKTFHQERYEDGRWKKGLGKTRRVPYRLHKVVNAKRVYIVEGEKDCKTLRKWRLVATTSPMGAGKWNPEYARYFKGKHVVILPDNDTAGKAHSVDEAASLLLVAESVRIVELPDLPAKGDVTDWAQAGGTRAQLESLALAVACLDEAGLTQQKARWGFTDQNLASRLPFRVSNEGVFFLKEDRDGNLESVRVAARIDVVAQTRDATSTNWGRLARFIDNDGVEHELTIPMETLATDAGAVRARLQSEGLPFISTAAGLRDKFSEYLQTAPVDRRVRCVTRIGWYGDTFVLPGETIGRSGAEAVLFQSAYETDNFFNVSGTVEDWQNNLGRFCSGNSRLIFAASCAFAGPTLSLVGGESGGVHFVGPSSIGKSTALLVGGSVCGGGVRSGFLQSWRTTINGLEGVAAQHNDNSLFIDELSQVDPREAAETAYLLGNGQGKIRMTRTIGVRKKLTWNVLYVSSGEITLADHAASAGKRTRGGAEVRLVNIAADAGKGLGLS